MELGNMVFGNSRGEYGVPRTDDWLDPLAKLFEAINPDRDNSWREYGVEFENDVFSVMPYWWGDCTCGKDCPIHDDNCAVVLYGKLLEKKRMGYASGKPGENGFAELDIEKLFEFDKNNPFPKCTCGAQEKYDELENARIEFCGDDHSPECYIKEYEKIEGIETYENREWFHENKLKPLYKKHGFNTDKKDWYFGCAVRCDCGYFDKCDEWELLHPHDKNCKLVKPNFEYKPTGFELQWYKYPLRDSYMNQKITVAQFNQIIEKCIESLEK
jgi:hypothetical protein